MKKLLSILFLSFILLFCIVTQKTYAATCPPSTEAGFYNNPNNPNTCYSKIYVGRNTSDNMGGSHCAVSCGTGGSSVPNACIVTSGGKSYAGWGNSGVDPAGCNVSNWNTPLSYNANPLNLTVQVKDTKGNGVSGVQIMVNYADKYSTAATTGTNGIAVISGKLYAGDHYVITASGPYLFSNNITGQCASGQGNVIGVSGNTGCEESDTVWSCGTDLVTGGSTAPCIFTVPAPNTINGSVFFDSNNDGKQDNGESNYKGGGAKVTVSGNGKSYTVTADGSGNYSVGGLVNGNWCATLSTVPNTFQETSATQDQHCISLNNGQTGTAAFGITPITISGNVFIDYTDNGTKDANYTAGANVTIKQGGKTIGTATTNGNGNYTIPNNPTANGVPNGNTTVTLTIPAGYKKQTATTNPQTVNVNHANVNNVNFGLTPIKNITGNIYLDYNNNGTKDANYLGKATITVTQSGKVVGQTTSDPNTGNYTAQDVPSGSDVVTLTTPPTYLLAKNSTNPQTVTVVGSDVNNINFGLTTQQSISGYIYNDVDGNKKFAAPDTPYKQPATLTITGPVNLTVTSAADGSYNTNTKQPLPPGKYIVSFNGPPSGYYMTYPLTTVPPSFTVTVGQNGNCVPSGNDASCQNGNIINLNFGITNALSWFQNICGDIRQDTGIIDKIPPAPSCGPYTGPYAIQSAVGVCSAAPGIAFTGDTDQDFGNNGGQAAANPYNYIAGGSMPKYAELFSGKLHSSYAYLLAKTQQAGITPTDLANPSKGCNGGNLSSCTLNNLPHGVYQANGDVHLQQYNFSGNQQYVFLIKGDLYIEGNITITQGSTVTFAVSANPAKGTPGNVFVAANVGNPVAPPAPIDITTPDIEGFYIADNSFIVNGTPNICSTGKGDNTLVTRGSVITNAAHTGGKFINNRTLCGSNPVCPAVSIQERPDLLLFSPSFIKNSYHLWQEVAP